MGAGLVRLVRVVPTKAWIGGASAVGAARRGFADSRDLGWYVGGRLDPMIHRELNAEHAEIHRDGGLAECSGAAALAIS